MTLLEFQCQGHRFALPLRTVRRVLASAQPTPLPGTPEIVLGVLNIGGEIVTIIDFRRRMGLPFAAIEPSQRLLLIDIPGFCIGFIVDEVSGVATRDVDASPAVPDPLAAAGHVSAVLRMDDGVCVICDPEKFLFGDEKILLDTALERLRDAAH